MYSLQCNPVLNLRVSLVHLVAQGLSFMVYECLVVLSVYMHRIMSMLTIHNCLKCSAVRKIPALGLLRKFERNVYSMPFIRRS